MSLLPREHGAYGQCALPLVTAYAVAGLTRPSVLIGVAMAASLLAHEPMLVLLGRRGARDRRERRRPAAAWLAATSATAVSAAVAAAWLAPAGSRWSLAVPLVPALVLVVAVAANREKSASGEVSLALACSLAAVPVCVVSGASMAVAFGIGIAFAITFVSATLAVRVILRKARRGAGLAFMLLAAFAVFAMAVRGALPWTAAIAVAPALVTAAALALFPPSPVRLRTVGWTLASAAMTTAVLLVAGL
jgi:hypothetical protein